MGYWERPFLSNTWICMGPSGLALINTSTSIYMYMHVLKYATNFLVFNLVHTEIQPEM